VSQKPDNIAAIATAAGRGGIGVIRISGRDIVDIGKSITGRQLSPRFAVYTTFLASDQSVIDQGIALFFPSPHSYTGEDVLELQGHGGPAVMQLLLQRCLELGARLAQPGEFTQRAFLNDKMDLAQAESVSDLIEATTQQAARSAVRSMQGEFSKAIHTVVDKLINLRMLVEATLDFPEEDGISVVERTRLEGKLASIQDELTHIEAFAKQGSILREGAQVVLVGAPNVGKSSLLNRLAGEDVALVSEIAGTTRDAIRQSLQLRGVPLHIVDTAGLRETDDVVERLGIALTQQNIDRADLILVLSDESNQVATCEVATILDRLPQGIPRIFVHNKIDVVALRSPQKQDDHVYVSAKTGLGIEALQDKILRTIGWHQEAGVFMARERHLVAIAKAKQHLVSASQHLEMHELLAEELRYGQAALNEITGEFAADDLLGEIFSRFCIGK
jgi:tRNA modification GTPase